MEVHKWNASGSPPSRHILPWRWVSWAAHAEHRFALDEATAMMHLKGDHPVDDVASLTNDMEDLLAVDVDAEDL